MYYQPPMLPEQELWNEYTAVARGGPIWSGTNSVGLQEQTTNPRAPMTP